MKRKNLQHGRVELKGSQEKIRLLKSAKRRISEKTGQVPMGQPPLIHMEVQFQLIMIKVRIKKVKTKKIKTKKKRKKKKKKKNPIVNLQVMMKMIIPIHSRH